MAKERDPRRDQAYEIWKNSDGQKKLNEIAKELGISDGTVRGWKNKDQWEKKLNGTFQSDERNVPNKRTERSNTRGAPLGNQNAVGNRGGAPKGNKNALGNEGGAPLRNENAVKTGEHKSLWLDMLNEDEQELINGIGQIDPVEEVIDSIKLYSFRERFIVGRIEALKNGMTSAQKSTLKQRKLVKEQIKVEDPLKGGYRYLEKEDYQMVIVQEEEVEGDPIDRVLAHEESLTRIQDKKIKAIKTLFDMTQAFEHDKRMNEAKLRIMEEKWAKEQGDTNNQKQQSEDWVSGLQSVFEKRKAKRNVN